MKKNIEIEGELKSELRKIQWDYCKGIKNQLDYLHKEATRCHKEYIEKWREIKQNATVAFKDDVNGQKYEVVGAWVAGGGIILYMLHDNEGNTLKAAEDKITEVVG